MSSNTVSIINNVTVYLPECAVHVTADSISYTGSQEFQPTTWEYFKVSAICTTHAGSWRDPD